MAKSKRRPHLILAIDQGTTGTKAVLVDEKLRLVAEHLVEFRQHFPKPGWVEHDLDEVWKSVEQAVRGALRKARAAKSQIAVIGATNQRETTALWNRRSGRPIHKAIVWQDRRTASRCEPLKGTKDEQLVRRTTGLVIDPYFSATKIEWLLKNVTGARRAARDGKLVFGTIDTYLTWRLSGGKVHTTDVSNASRTSLMDLKKRRWSPALCELFSVPKDLLPSINANDAILGETHGVRFLPDGVPIASPIGDQQSALFGQTCFRSGEAKCTYGTGAFLVVNTGERIVRSRHGMLSTAAWELRGRPCYALEGSSFVAGAIVQWLRDGLRLFEKASDIEALAASVPDSGGVAVVPALAGLGAPHWDPSARGLICGLTRGTTKAHVARAALEGIALQIHDLARAVESDLDRKLRHLRVDGGASLNNLLMQYQADLLRLRVQRPASISTTALGSAALAGLAIGLFPSLEAVRKTTRVAREFRPKMPLREVRAHLTLWENAIAKARL